MHAKRLALVALAASLLLVGAAGAATAQPATDTAAPDEPGPPDDAPGGPPDFVSDIHDAISEFLSGGIDHLGSVISDLTPGDDGADGDANETAETRPDDER